MKFIAIILSVLCLTSTALAEMNYIRLASRSDNPYSRGQVRTRKQRSNPYRNEAERAKVRQESKHKSINPTKYEQVNPYQHYKE